MNVHKDPNASHEMNAYEKSNQDSNQREHIHDLVLTLSVIFCQNSFQDIKVIKNL